MTPKGTARRDIPGKLRVPPDSRVRLRDDQAGRCFGFERDQADIATEENRRRLSDLQYKMFADGRFSVLVVLQAIDGGGKDSTIRRVFSAFNPQGCTVAAFKAPTAEDLSHDFLWRVHRHVPARGELVVFNRSHYEDVLVARVEQLVPEPVWQARYGLINDFERLLGESGTRVIKLFLHISRDEQKRRFEERIAERSKQWKFDPADLEKRLDWGPYRAAFEAVFSRCSPANAPWYVIPSDRKWFRDFAVSQILRQELEQLPLRWPPPRFDPARTRVT